MTKKILLIAVVLFASLGLLSEKSSAEYPDKNIEVVVPFSAGGGSDTTARLFSKILVDEKIVPVKMNVINKPGGSSAIGMSYVAAKKGNPYYLLLITPSFMTTPLQGGVGVNYKDFTAICLLGFDDYFIVSKKGGDFNGFDDFLKQAKAKPGEVKVGGAAKGSGDHILIERLSDNTGAKFNYIPFQGGSNITTAILGGHIDAGILNVSEAASFIESNQLIALVTPGEKRIGLFPNVPTLKDKNIEIVSAMPRGVVAPADIPQEAVNFLGGAFKKLTESEAWKKDYINKFMFSSNYKNPKETAEYFAETTEVYKKYLLKLGIIKNK